MAKIEKFENIEARQKARGLAKVVYAITGDSAFSRDFVLHNQIRRAVVSVISNIAEGFDRSRNREFIYFLFDWWLHPLFIRFKKEGAGNK